MSTLQDDLLKKYGVGPKAAPTSGGSGATVTPPAKSSLQDSLVSKYLTVTKDDAGKEKIVPIRSLPPGPRVDTLSQAPKDDRKADTLGSRFARLVLPKSLEEAFGVAEYQRKPAARTQADQQRISGAAITKLQMERNPEAISPQEYFRRGLSFGHNLNPIGFIEGDTAQPDIQDLPEPTTGEQAFAQALGNLTTMVLAQPVIEAAAVSVISKVPGGGNALKFLADAAAKSPWAVGYPLAITKAGATGGLFGAIMKNNKTLAENVIETGGAFAAFTAIAYPIATFFKPIFRSVGKMEGVPANVRTSLTDPKLEQFQTSETIWFRNPKNPDQYLKVTQNGVDFVDSTAAKNALSASGAKSAPTLTKLEVEAFQRDPSLYEKLRTWITGDKSLNGTRVEFAKPVQNAVPGAPGGGEAPLTVSPSTASPSPIPAQGAPIPGVPVVPGVPAAPAPAQTSPVSTVINTPVKTETLARIAAFTPPEQAAFTREIVEKVNEALGTKLTEKGTADLPQDVVVKNIESPDGRPAQFTSEGKIELFVPNLLKDIATMMKGGQILAHEGAFSSIFKMKPNESVSDLTVRYLKEVLLHEKGHANTINLEDQQTAARLRQGVIEAQATGNQSKITEAKTKQEAFAKTLEDKANQYLKDNRARLEKELFPNPVRPPSLVDLGVKPKPETVVKKVSRLLKDRFKAQQIAAKSGFSAGKKEGVKKGNEKTSSRYEEAIEKIKDRNTSVALKRSQLIHYAEDFLPARSKGKFLRMIENTTSDKDFFDTLKSMQKEAALQERKSLISDITSELKDTRIRRDPKTKLPKGRFSIEAQRDLNRIRANVDGSYLLARERIAEIVAEWQGAHPDELLPADLIHEIQMLKSVGIKEMSPKELRSTLADIRSIKETGKTKFELDKFNRDSEMQRNKDKIIDVVTGGKTLPSEGKVFMERENRARTGIKAIIEQMGDFLIAKQRAFENVMDYLSARDTGSKPYQSFLSRFTADRINPAFNDEYLGKVRWILKIKTGIKESYGLTKDKEILGLYQDLAQEVKIPDVVMADGTKKTLEITRDEAIQMYMWMQDPTLEGSFVTGLNMGPQALEAVKSVLTPEDLKFAKWMFEGYYRPQYDQINPVFQKEFGVDLPFNENYSPAVKNIETVIPDNVLLAREQAKYASARNGNLKERVKNNVPLSRVGAVENMMRHLVRMEHYKAWAGPMGDFRRVFSDKDLRIAITDIYGKDAMKAVDEALNDFARGGVSQDKIVKWADSLRRNTTRAILGANWKVALKQSVGILNYGIEVPMGDFVAGIYDFWKEPLEKAKFLYEQSAAFQERFGEGYNVDIQVALDQGYAKEIARSEGFTELMFTMIRTMDKFTVYQGAWTAFQSKYKEITGHKFEFDTPQDPAAVKEAMQYSEEVTNRVQESSRIDTLSELQRQGSVARLFTMFASQKNKYWRIIIDSMRNLKAGRGSKAENIRRLLWAWLIVPAIYQIASRTVGKKKEGEPLVGPQDVLSVILGPLADTLIVGDMVNWGLDKVFGKPYAYSPTPGFSAVEDFGKAITDFTAGNAGKATTEVIDGIGKLRGVPTTLVTSPARDAIKAANDGPSASGGMEASF